MKQARYAVIPEFDLEVVQAVYYIPKATGQPNGAMRIRTLGEGGEFELYIGKELLAGWEPKAGDVMFVQLSIDGTYEPRINVRSIRPAATADKARSA